MGRNRTQEPIGTDYIEFGERLRSLRESKRMTQAELAEEMGVSKTSIVNYETGTRKIPLSFVKRFANFFGVSVDEMLGLTINTKGERAVENATRWAKEIGNPNYTDEEMDELLSFAKYLIYKRGQK